MNVQSIYRTFNRYRTLHTDRISSLPIAILMPHSACNCRCVMCDIWKGNASLRQLTGEDIRGLLDAFKAYGTQQVVMSGGEALLNPSFFRLCEIIKSQKIKISLLSTGLTLKKHAELIVRWVDDVIVSLDGNETLHDSIRNVPGAFKKLKEGIAALRSLDPAFRVSGRCVIHRLNFRNWAAIIDSARDIGLDTISFLPADVSSTAFNRETRWDRPRQDSILLSEDEVFEMRVIVDYIILTCGRDFKRKFIAESPAKLANIHAYYAAFYGYNEFPYKKCNAPWVSTVVEADGTVRPCFFHEAYGNIRSASLGSILNGPRAIEFRRTLDMDNNDTCRKCVCSLYLPPSKNFF